MQHINCRAVPLCIRHLPLFLYSFMILYISELFLRSFIFLYDSLSSWKERISFRDGQQAVSRTVRMVVSGFPRFYGLFRHPHIGTESDLSHAGRDSKRLSQNMHKGAVAKWIFAAAPFLLPFLKKKQQNSFLLILINI